VKICATCGTEYSDEQSFCPTDGSSLKSVGGAADLVGSIVADRYRITKKLGEGGMGAVYLGEHVKMGRLSAIKVISKSMANDPEAIARFNREASNASRINQHNVCSIYDFGETDDGIIYLAMEYIEGEALTDLLEREGALAPKRAADILQQTANALDAAHELTIVHRDLKPDNIMIAKSREGADLVKVVDFGIAKAMGGDEEGQHVTKTGLVVGTPEYMSPEQLSGDQVDGRSDIYSLALVFFRTLTGTLPFQADTAQEIMIKRLTDEPMTLADALPSASFPPALQQIMDRALERMPSNRYSSAAQFGRDVVQAISGMADIVPRVDTDGATQLLDSSEITDRAAALEDTAVIPKTRVSGTQPVPTPDTPMPAAPAVTVKKAPVGAIAAVVGALVVGSASVAVVMNRGTAEPAGPDSSPQTSTDSVTSVTDPPIGQPNGTLRAGGGNPSEGRQQPAPSQPADQTPTTNQQDGNRTAARTNAEDDPPPVNTATNPAWISLENAEDNLLELMFRFDEPDPNHAAIRDTATAYYNAVGITDADRALAAFVTAQAIFDGTQDRLRAIDWARRAVALDGTSRSYRDLLNRLQGGGGS
jgi:serine/threonine-protein kinase